MEKLLLLEKEEEMEKKEVMVLVVKMEVEKVEYRWPKEVRGGS